MLRRKLNDCAVKSVGCDQQSTACICHFTGELFWMMTKSKMHPRSMKWDGHNGLCRWEGRGVHGSPQDTVVAYSDSRIGDRDKHCEPGATVKSLQTSEKTCQRGQQKKP